MRRLPAAMLALLLMTSCTDQKNLSEQLTVSFANHLKRIDPSASLDSVHILWNAPINQKLGRIIDDSVYVREFTAVQAQLASAKQKNDADSMEFYQAELHYMEKPIDSLTKSIAAGDTTRRFGSLIGVAYYITRNQKKKVDSTIIVLDSVSTMLYTEYMDSAIKRAVKTLN